MNREAYQQYEDACGAWVLHDLSCEYCLLGGDMCAEGKRLDAECERLKELIE